MSGRPLAQLEGWAFAAVFSALIGFVAGAVKLARLVRDRIRGDRALRDREAGKQGEDRDDG